ncbi:sensor histidine kinase [Neglectibacter caecimuris]|uniref:sensor histidine kinase n=1 Tax=Neglectibacter caecimuris TaxID=3093658 RepID=UPI002AC99B10|nr:HAMP domain-containing sensor histidine kinase [Neglectibacter sp. M00184]
MKSKLTILIRLFVLLAVGFAVCSALYFLVDHVFDGAFVSWFEENFFITESHYYPADGTGETWSFLSWPKLKPVLLGVFIAGNLFWLAVVFLVSRLAAARREQQTVTDISRRLRVYLDGNADIAQVFPGSQAELSVQIAQLKAALLQNERTLKEEATRRNDLVAYLAHDLKTPLTSVIGYLSLLDEAPDMPREQRANYTRITLEKAYRLEKMINEFFEITRYNLQQILIQKEPVDLYYLLVQLTDELLPALEAHGNTVVLKAGESLQISGDADKLARAIGNVLKNAAAYSYPNTEILLSAEETADSVILRCTNRGKTIPKERLGLLFEKFYRLDEARTTSAGGAGLGLAIAKEIIALHGGTIFADSSDDAVTFTIILPFH